MRRKNLDYIRLLAAVLVFIGHARNFNTAGSVPWAHFVSEQSVYVFFSISGYLIFKSAQAHRPSAYILRRISRIMPALIVNLLCISFILSPAVALLNKQTWQLSDAISFLLKNCSLIPSWQTSIGDTLDGVGLNQTWNPPLWTLFFEVFCYVLILLVVHFFRNHNRAALSILCIIVSISVAISSSSASTVGITAIRLLTFFLMGAMFNYTRVRVAWAVLVFIGIGELLGSGSHIVLNSLLISFLLFVVLPSGEQESKFQLTGDYSYGIYIWHWPILQTVFTLEAFIGVSPSWVVSLGIAFPFVSLIAIASWHLLEKPCLLVLKRV